MSKASKPAPRKGKTTRKPTGASMTPAEYRKLMGVDRQPAIKQVLGRPVRGAVVGREPVALPTEYRVTLPFIPPSTNHLYVTVGKKRFPNPKHRKLAAIAKTLIHGRLDPTRVYALHIGIFCPCFNKGDGKVKKLDVSNRIKALEDWLAKGLDIDDSRFFMVHISKHDSAIPSTEVHIAALDANIVKRAVKSPQVPGAGSR